MVRVRARRAHDDRVGGRRARGLLRVALGARDAPAAQPPQLALEAVALRGRRVQEALERRAVRLLPLVPAHHLVDGRRVEGGAAREGREVEHQPGRVAEALELGGPPRGLPLEVAEARRRRLDLVAPPHRRHVALALRRLRRDVRRLLLALDLAVGPRDLVRLLAQGVLLRRALDGRVLVRLLHLALHLLALEQQQIALVDQRRHQLRQVRQPPLERLLVLRVDPPLEAQPRDDLAQAKVGGAHVVRLREQAVAALLDHARLLPQHRLHVLAAALGARAVAPRDFLVETAQRGVQLLLDELLVVDLADDALDVARPLRQQLVHRPDPRARVLGRRRRRAARRERRRGGRGGRAERRRGRGGAEGGAARADLGLALARRTCSRAASFACLSSSCFRLGRDSCPIEATARMSELEWLPGLSRQSGALLSESTVMVPVAGSQLGAWKRWAAERSRLDAEREIGSPPWMPPPERRPPDEADEASRLLVVAGSGCLLEARRPTGPLALRGEDERRAADRLLVRWRLRSVTRAVSSACSSLNAQESVLALSKCSKMRRPSAAERPRAPIAEVNSSKLTPVLVRLQERRVVRLATLCRAPLANQSRQRLADQPAKIDGGGGGRVVGAGCGGGA